MRGLISSLSPSRKSDDRRSDEGNRAPSPEPMAAEKAARQPSTPPGSLPRVNSRQRLPTGNHSRSNSMSTIGSTTDDMQVLRQEVTRLSDENASLTAQLEIAPKSTSEVQQLCRKLQTDNKRLSDAMDRRQALGKTAAGSDEVQRLRDENRQLREEKVRLQAEMEKVTKVATLVGSRLARLVMDARRSTSGNTQLVDELKHYNRRLEVENDRLHNIILITQGNRNFIDQIGSSSLGSEAEFSGGQRGGLNGLSSAELMRKLESSQSRLQEDMSKLSRDAANLQNLSVARSESGSVAPPRTPSIYEEDSLGPEDLQRQNARFADELDRLKDELAAAAASAEQVDTAHANERNALKRQLEEATSEAQQGEAKRQELQEAVDELEAHQLQLQRDLHAYRDFKEQARRLEQENSSLCEDMDKAMEEHARLAHDLATSESSLSAAQHRQQQLEETLQQALLVNEQRAAAYQEQMQHIERKTSMHERQMAGFRTEKQELLAQVAEVQGLRASAEEHAGVHAQLAEAHQALRAMEQSAAEQVSALTAQVGALQQERDEVSASTSDTIARLSSYVSALEREKYELLDNKAVEDAEKSGQIANLRRQMASMTEEKASQTVDSYAQTNALQRQRDELTSSLAAQSADMSAKITALHAEKEELNRQRAQLEADLTERIAHLERQRDDMAAAQAGELAEMSGKVAALQSQMSNWEELRGSHSQLGAQLARVQREKAALIGDQERTRLGFENATVELAQTHAQQLHRAEQERRGMETELSSLRSFTSELEGRSSHLEAQVAILAEERHELLQKSSQELHSLRSSRSTMEEELVALRSHLSDVERQSSTAQGELERRTSSMMQRHQELESNSSLLLSEKEQLQMQAAADMHRLEVANAELQDETSSAEAESAARALQLEEKASELAAQLEELRAQAAAHSDKLQEHNSQLLRRLEASIAALQEQNAGLRMDAATSASAFEADKLSLSQRLEDMEQGLQAQVSELHAERAQLTERCSSLQDHLRQQEALRIEAEAALAALAAEHEIASLEDGVSQQREHFLRVQSHHDALVAQLQNELETLSKAHSELQASSTAELRKSRSDTASLSTQMISLRRQHSDMQSASTNTAADIATLRANEAEVNMKLLEAEQERDAHAERARDLSERVEMFEREQSGHLGSHQKLQQANARLTAEHKELQQKHEEYTESQHARNVQLAEVMLGLEEQHAQICEERDGLQQELTSLRSNLEQAHASSSESARTAAILASLMQRAQVQHPDELEACMDGLQRRVEQLAEEASQAEQLRDGQQTLLSANQRMSRQLVELQRVAKGKALEQQSPAGSTTATNTPAEFSPSLSDGSSYEEEQNLPDDKFHSGNGETPSHMRNGAAHTPSTGPSSDRASTVQSPFSLFGGVPAQVPPKKLPARASTSSILSIGSRIRSQTSDLQDGSSKSKRKFWQRNPLKRGAAPAPRDSRDLALDEPISAFGNAVFEEEPEPVNNPTNNPSEHQHLDTEDEPLDLQAGSSMLNQLAAKHVQSAFDQYVDHDDVDGFMTKLGFTGFCPPTQAHDLEAAFDAALGVVEEDCIPPDADEWDKAMAASARSLLETWHHLAMGV
ncbi:hypothetical protein WJX73_005706 [Symbiochloris irregularis]|uniref:Uncharacterized protein n=1 Tax=Symbiochloris irregularis TaxID=706552 RepID=A0AAW1NUQ4_9CHLO